MKKLLIFLLFLIVALKLPVYADDIGLDDYTRGVENAWYGQKQITDEDFEKTVKKLEDKKNKKSQKKMKGQSMFKGEEEEGDDFFAEAKPESILLMSPVALETQQGCEIPVGHYTIVGKKEKNKVFLEFHQAHLLVARVEATQTTMDFGETAINFAKILPYDENFVKIIFGSLDFNAYAFVQIEKPLN